MDKVDCLAELLVLLRTLQGDSETIKRMRRLLYFLVAAESYEHNQITKGK
jgi:hypothetical protein